MNRPTDDEVRSKLHQVSAGDVVVIDGATFTVTYVETDHDQLVHEVGVGYGRVIICTPGKVVQYVGSDDHHSDKPFREETISSFDVNPPVRLLG